jgi:predicted CoA-substrate-specific enzyme activase
MNKGRDRLLYFAGVDIGAATAKAVILNNSKIISYAVMSTGPNVPRIAESVLGKVLEEKGLSKQDLNNIVATGYGRMSVPFLAKSITEIACHAKGAHYILPEIRMVIDIGGQDSKAIRLDEEGNVTDFVMNDKCAAGTGRFLEVIARVLDLKMDELGPISIKSKEPCKISSVCTVFAESEVISLRAVKESTENIIAGIHNAIAKRISSMASKIGFDPPIAFTGGVAKNSGVIKALEVEIGKELFIPEEPQIIGALGAALFARDQAE